MGILKGRRRPALPALAAGILATLGLSLLAAPAEAQSQFTHGVCLETDTFGPELGLARVCDPTADGYDASYFGLNPLTAYVAPSARLEVDNNRGPNLFSVTLSAHCEEPVMMAWKTADHTATAGHDYQAVAAATYTFRPGTNGAQCGVNTLQDDIAEPVETFEVWSYELSPCPAGKLCAAGDARPARLCIIDDDGGPRSPGDLDLCNNVEGGGRINPPIDQGEWEVEVSPTSLTVLEDSAGETYRVRLDSQPSGAVTVDVSGYANTDVRVNPDTLTFTDTTYGDWQDVQVTVVDDVDAEDDPDVTLTHTANGGGYRNVAGDDVTVMIADDDTASNRFTLTVNPTEVSEGVGSSGMAVTVTATLNNAPRTSDTEVTVSVGAGTATTGDFEAVDDFPLTIDEGEMIGTADFRLKPDDDDVDENDETVRVSGSASGLTRNSPAPTVTILDNDTEGVSLSTNSLTVREDESQDYMVWLESQPTSNVTVAITGHSGTDLTLSSNSLTFTDQNWDQPQTVMANAGADSDSAQDPDITLTHRATGGGYSGDTAVLTVTIIDTSRVSDMVLLSVDPARVSESRGSSGETVTVTGQLNGATRTTATTVTVSVGDSADSAIEGTDYQSVTDFPLTISANQASGTATFRFLPENDTADENDETVTVSGTTTASGLTSVESAELVIVDDDGAPSGIELSVSPRTLREDVGAMDVQVTAKLVGGGTLLQDTVVDLDVGAGDGTAIRGSDYTAPDPGTITIEDGMLSGTATFTFTVVDDTEDESSETVQVTGDTTSSPALTVHPATITIEDNDGSGGGGGGGGGGRGGGGGGTAGARSAGGGGLELLPRNARASEGAGRMVFTVDLSGVSTSAVSVRWQTADRTATAGADYTAASGTLKIPAGARSGKIEVTLLTDRLDEHDETFAIEFSGAQGAGLARTQAIGTIEDDDDEPELLVADASAPEGDGRLGFLVFLASDSGRTVSVDYATRGVSATMDTDYRPASGTLTIPPGSAGETIWVTILDDSLDEANETVQMVLSRPRYAVPADLLGIGTIEDDDAEPEPLVPDVTVAERARGMQFVVTLDAISAKRITWDYQTVDGTAEADSDYGGRMGTLTFEPGETRGTVPIEIVDDTMDEVDEDFRLSLRNPREPTWPAVEATAVIVDDDDNAIVADAWVSRFGRTVASQVVEAVGGRFAGMGGPGSHFLLGMDPFRSHLGFRGARGYRRWEPRWGEDVSGSPGSASLGLDAGQLLSGTSFVVRSQEDQEPYEGGFDGRWTAWGRGSYLQFDGLEPGVGLTGEVFNVTAGFDFESGPLIAGLAIAGSVGTGDYHVARTDVQSERMGAIWSILGSAHPYVQVSLAEWLRIWGLGGIGSGTLRISGSEQDADLRMKMWAVGGRSDLRAPVAGLGLALKSDVFWVEMESGPTDVRRGSIAESSRLRLMLESSFRLVSVWGGDFSPLVEAGFRQDDGDAETGRGLEVASGFRYRHVDRGLFVEATARSLVSHEDERYREWGVGGTVRLDPGPDYLGLAVQVNSSHGAAASTVQRLWSDAGAVSTLPAMVQGRHEAEIGYGFETLRGGAMVIPFSGFAYSPSGVKSFRLGSRMKVGSRWMLSLQADRSQYGFRGPSYGLVLRGHLLPELPVRLAPESEEQ